MRIATPEQKLAANRIVKLAIEVGFLERGPCAICGDPYGLAHHMRHTELRKLEQFEPLPIPVGWILPGQIKEKYGLSLYWFHSHKRHFSQITNVW